MTTLIYDGTFEGLLTAVFEIYERRLTHIRMQKGEWHNTALFENVIKVVTESSRAARVLKGLKQKLSAQGLLRLYAAHMAEMEGEDDNLAGYIRYVFDSANNVEEDYSNKYVMRISEIVRMVRREKHKMEACIHFRELKDKILYSVIEPDFNILPLLIKHFRNKYAGRKWIIYDMRRSYGLYYDLHETQYISLDFATVNPGNVIAVYNDDEAVYQDLWRNYFTSVNIPARKNTRLHLRPIPRRYWKHLTEKI